MWFCEKNHWAWYSTHLKSPRPKGVQPCCELSFTMQFVQPKIAEDIQPGRIASCVAKTKTWTDSLWLLAWVEYEGMGQEYWWHSARGYCTCSMAISSSSKSGVRKWPLFDVKMKTATIHHITKWWKIFVCMTMACRLRPFC